jgi:hypothetical protein
MKGNAMTLLVRAMLVGSFVSVLTGCSSCSKEETPPPAPPTPSSEPSSVSLVGPKMKAPALKGVMAGHDGGAMKSGN